MAALRQILRVAIPAADCFVVTHPAGLEDAPQLYRKFRDKEDGVIKVLLRPGTAM